MKYGLRLIFFSWGFQMLQHYLLKRLFFLQWSMLACEFISELDYVPLMCISTLMLIPHCFDYCSFIKPDSEPNFPLFQVVLAILGLFSYTFLESLSQFLRKSLQGFWLGQNLIYRWIQRENYHLNNIEFYNPWTWYISPFI